MRALVTAHILIGGELFCKFHLVDEPQDGGLGKLAFFDRSLVLKLPVDLGRGKAGIVMLKITDLLFKRIVDLAAHAAVGAASRKKAVKSGVLVSEVPLLDRAGGLVADLPVRGFDPFGGDITVVRSQGFIVFLRACDKWCDGGIAHERDRLTFVLVHGRASLYDFSSS